MPAHSVLDNRALNRATLERQLLLRRHDMSTMDAIEHLVGLQSQLPNPPYLGLWSRLKRFELNELTDLMYQRQVVRGGLMRGTLHLTTSEDFRRLRSVVESVFVKAQRAFRHDTDRLNLDELVSFATKVLDDHHHTGAELRKLLGERWPECNASSLLYSVQCLLPIIYVPPGGTWGKGGSSSLATAESWFGRPLPTATDPSKMIVRYLAAFGPASVMDIQSWSGLTHLKQFVERLRPELRTFRSAETGVELFDLPNAPLPDRDTAAPVRLLPDYDNLLVAHADRTRVISDEYRAITHTRNGMVAPTILIDGVVAGRWRLTRKKTVATLEIEPFKRLSSTASDKIEAEATNLLAFAVNDAGTRNVSFNSSGT